MKSCLTFPSLASEEAALAKLSLDQLKTLARSLTTLKHTRDQKKLSLFQPNPGFQDRFIRSKAPVRLVTCGNQSGKTHIGCVESAYYALAEHPFKTVKRPNVGVIVTAKSFKDGIQDEIIPKLTSIVGTADIVRIKNSPQGIPATLHWRSGSVTYLMSAEQDDVAFESKSLNFCWIDEPVRRAIYIALSRGMLTTRGHIWFTMTPLAEPWIYDEIYMPGVSGKNKDIEVFEGSSDENRMISSDEKKRFFSRLTQDEIETRWYGKFRHLAGRVFKEYEPRRHRVPPFDIPEHWPVWVSIDPHRHNPHAVVFLAVSPKNFFYLCNEIYIRCSINELAGWIKEIGVQYNVVNTLIDTSAQEDGWAKMSAREMLEEQGVRTKLAQKKNLKASGITLINQLFKDDRLFIFETCERTHRELTLQVFKKSKRDPDAILEEPEKKYDHCTDAIRYLLNERPFYSGMARIKEYGAVYVRE